MAEAPEETVAVERLAGALVPSTTILGAYEHVVTEIGALARAGAAILLLHDPERPGHLYFGHAWAARAPDLQGIRARFGGFHERCGAEPARWEERVRSAGLGPGRLLLFPAGAGGLPRAGVWLSRHDSAGPADGFGELSPTFVHYASAMLENHVRAYASTIAGAVGGPPGGGTPDPLDVLQWAAELLGEHTGGEAALVYAGQPDQMIVARCSPEAPGIRGLEVATGSLTWESIQASGAQRVLDATDRDDGVARRLDRSVLDRIVSAHGWAEARSWLCCPVVHDGRCVGAIKVLTSNAGCFLGVHQEVIARAVAERAALEIHKMGRALMLDALNHVVRETAGKGGSELGQALIPSLNGWIERFVRTGCELAVVARVTDRTLVLQRSPGIDEGSARALDAFSRSLGRGAEQWRAGARAHSPLRDQPGAADLAGVATPIVLPGQERLMGHLFVLHARPFSAEDEAVLREAARELAVLLNGERLRHEWTLSAGMFRHALLGPVQGLTSAARMLGVLAEQAGADVTELRARVDKEAEIIRLWRENQRLYIDGKVEIRTRQQDLRPIVERCVARYRSLLDTRGIGLREEWPIRGALTFPFDEQALDLALSNLLDNARKYAFFNREVTVGVRVLGAMVQIWVEDIGHPIPDRLDEDIYKMGGRMDWADPFRVITGEGLGLPMARAVIQEHDGRLYHASEPLGRGSADGTAPYRVRFTIELPHHWRRRHGS